MAEPRTIPIDELINKRIEEKLHTDPSRYIQMDELAWIQYKRKELEAELNASQQRITHLYHDLTSVTAPQGKWAKALYFVDKGMLLYQGLRFGYQVGDAILSIKNLFKRKKR